MGYNRKKENMHYRKTLQALGFGFLSLLVAFFPTIASAQWSIGKMQASQSQLPSGSILSIIGNLMGWLLALVGMIAIIGFVIAGILYLTSAGDEEQIERAKKAMLYSIIGVVVALIGLVIIFAVDTLLSGGFFGGLFF